MSHSGYMDKHLVLSWILCTVQGSVGATGNSSPSSRSLHLSHIASFSQAMTDNLGDVRGLISLHPPAAVCLAVRETWVTCRRGDRQMKWFMCNPLVFPRDLPSVSETIHCRLWRHRYVCALTCAEWLSRLAAPMIGQTCRHDAKHVRQLYAMRGIVWLYTWG